MNGFSAHAAVLPFIEQREASEVLLREHSKSGGGVIFFMTHPVMGLSLDVLRCPSDGDSEDLFVAMAATNYAANLGTGVLKSGFDGAFQFYDSPSTGHQGGTVSLSAFGDGTSMTAALSEILVASDGQDLGRPHPGRAIFSTANSHVTTLEFESLCDECSTGQYNVIPGPGGVSLPEHDPYARGRPWAYGSWGTLYTHSLGPNRPSCYNGSNTVTGVYSAYSNHSSTINVAYVDGHVEAVANSIDRNVWRATGSRHGQEQQQQ
jgi:prepilin-type processing-associated H-X9-DG protein